MAGSSFFALFDDIATMLDDVAVLSKLAAKKTVGVLGDDLALNAKQVTGLTAARELPVVWAVTKGSFINKLILVPSALAISALAPWLVTPLLMLGGAYLCYEGFEKLAHKFLHRKEDEERKAALDAALANPMGVDVVSLEKDKIKGAIRTDFILSAEIIAITLGTVATSPIVTRVTVMSGLAVLFTVGVYALVAAIVKLDDLGLWLTKRPVGALQAVGKGILAAAPWLMKTLSVVGTAAMFLVGGGILMHGTPMLARLIEGALNGMGSLAHTFLSAFANGVTGVIAGALIVAAVMGVKRVLATRCKRVRAIRNDAPSRTGGR